MAKKSDSTPLTSEGAKIGEPVPKAIVDTNTASVGVPLQPDTDTEEEMAAVRKQLEMLRQQLSEASKTVEGGVRHVVRQTKATVSLHPVSALVGVAIIVGLSVFAIATWQSRSRRSRYDQTLNDLRDLYDRARSHF